ncbi:MAG: hypothetical protein KatS3mg109_1028 [Pirellulaceae bacterium]|nr:MAG: hypothetical protein KatS3mg109_1028 [Pirellulaceae bacterium]
MRHPNAVSAAILLFFVFLAIGSMETEESVQQDISNAVPTVHVTATQLVDDYKANEIAADEKYKGEVIVVSGTIESIGTDIWGTMYVTLMTGNPIVSVQCMFADKYKSQLANVRRGQYVTIKGRCEGKHLNVLLRGCSFK